MRPILFTTAALAALSTHAYAQTPVSELVVTAPRLATTPDLVTGLRAVEREEIEARQATFAADVLNTLRCSDLSAVRRRPLVAACARPAA